MSTKIEQETRTKMQQALEHLKQELKGLRAGRASPALVEGVMVEVYGSQMRLKELATITSPEARQLIIAAFDTNNNQHIAKSLEKANLGVRVVHEGKQVRITLPELNEERRKEIIAQAHKKREECKVHIRNIRRDANEQLKKMKTSGELPEDDMKRLEKQTQELTEKNCKEADELCSVKEKEIMTI